MVFYLFISIWLYSGWVPPADSWHSSDRLPYGWETAVDPQGKVYFINHLSKTTTAEDPRKWEGVEQVSSSKRATNSIHHNQLSDILKISFKNLSLFNRRPSLNHE